MFKVLTHHRLSVGRVDNGHLKCLEYALENGCPRLVSDDQLRAECMSRRAEFLAVTEFFNEWLLSLFFHKNV